MYCSVDYLGNSESIDVFKDIGVSFDSREQLDTYFAVIEIRRDMKL